MHRVVYGIGEFFAPILRDSKFKETGVLTPEEFVAAGDYLTYKCPTWQWAPGKEKKKSYLPVEKQYLVTKNVPCLKRVSQMKVPSTIDEDMPDDDDLNDVEWIQTHFKEDHHLNQLVDEIPDMETFEDDNNVIDSVSI